MNTSPKEVDSTRRLVEEALDRLHQRQIALWGASTVATSRYPKRPSVQALATLLGYNGNTLYRYLGGQRMSNRMVARLRAFCTIPPETE